MTEGTNLTTVDSISVSTMDPDALVVALMATPPPSDPYPFYERLRDIAPRWRSNVGLRVFSRYDDCLEVLRSPKFHSAVYDPIATSHPRFAESRALQSVQHMLLFTNPPQHSRLRRLVNRAFVPSAIDGLRPRIVELVEHHLDRLEILGECDLVADFANVVPMQVVAILIGVPPEDHGQLKMWNDHVVEAVGSPLMSDEVLARADTALIEFHEYLRGFIAQRRKAPTDDIISALISAEDNDQRLTEDELINFCYVLLGAGGESNANLISVGTLALCQNPTQLQALRSNPSLIGPAVEELLRYEAPVQMVPARVAIEDTAIGGEQIAEGELCVPLIGAANRDPSVYAEPDVLRIDRPLAKPHLAFGGGPHFCIGAGLARMEAEEALKRLLVDRFPGLTVLSEAPDWRDALLTRGVKELTVRLR